MFKNLPCLLYCTFHALSLESLAAAIRWSHNIYGPTRPLYTKCLKMYIFKLVLFIVAKKKYFAGKTEKSGVTCHLTKPQCIYRACNFFVFVLSPAVSRLSCRHLRNLRCLTEISQFHMKYLKQVASEVSQHALGDWSVRKTNLVKSANLGQINYNY